MKIGIKQKVFASTYLTPNFLSSLLNLYGRLYHKNRTLVLNLYSKRSPASYPFASELVYGFTL